MLPSAAQEKIGNSCVWFACQKAYSLASRIVSEITKSLSSKKKKPHIWSRFGKIEINWNRFEILSRFVEIYAGTKWAIGSLFITMLIPFGRRQEKLFPCEK
jgi:hypothetical protein